MGQKILLEQPILTVLFIPIFCPPQKSVALDIKKENIIRVRNTCQQEKKEMKQRKTICHLHCLPLPNRKKKVFLCGAYEDEEASKISTSQ